MSNGKELEEDRSLLHPRDAIGYGSIRREFQSKERSRTGFIGLVEILTKRDWSRIIIGSTFAVIQGACIPLLGYIFGTMTDVFMYTSASPSKKLVNLVDEYYNTNKSGPSIFRNKDFERLVGQLHKPEEDFMENIHWYSFIYFSLGVICLVSSFIQVFLWEITGEKQLFILRKRFFSQVLRQDLTWYDTDKHGDFSTSLSDDLDRVRDGIGYKFSMVIQYLSTFISGFVLGMILNWRLTCMLLLIGPLLIATSAYMTKVISGATSREQLKYSLAGTIVEEVLSCFKTVLSCGSVDFEAERYKSALEKGRKMAMKKYYILSIGMLFVYIMLYGSYAFGFWYGSVLVSDGTATTGQIFGVLFCMLSTAFSIGNVLPYLNSVSMAFGASKIVFNVINRVPPIDPYSTLGFKPLNIGALIKFSNVFFSYPTRPEVEVLSSVNFEVRPGESVAIIGESGSGKSTIINLLLRFYDPTSGDVTVDNVNIKDLNLKWWRNKIGMVSQEPVLFGESILNNIKFGRENVSFKEIVAVANLANAHSFIKQLPQGYNTLIGDRGAQLSGGQKQRIAIARALIRNPKILLLDEATSAMDTHSEGLVHDALTKAMEGRTTIIIAHRLSTVKNVDRIYVMNKGVIVESGNHSDLMNLKGAYYKFVSIQSNENDKQSIKENEFSSNLRNDSTDSDIYSKSNLAENIEPNYSALYCIYRLAKLNGPEWYFLILGVLACSVYGLIPTSFAFCYSEMIVTYSLTGDELKSTTIFWCLVLLGVGTICGISLCLQIISMASAAEHLLARIRHLCFRNIIRQEVCWFDKENCSIGRLITQLARDAPLVKAAAGLRAGQIITALVTLSSGVGIAVYSGWKLSMILLVMTPLIIYSSYKQMSLVRNNQIRDIESMDTAGKIASECFHNLKTVQALAKEEVFHRNYINHLEKPYKESSKLSAWFAATYAFSQAIVFFVYTVAFWYGGYLVNTSQMIPNDVYRVFFAISFCATAVGQGTAYLQDFARGQMAAQSIFKLMDKKSLVDPLSDEGVKIGMKGKIEFRNIKFCYPSRPHLPVFNGLNLKVECGQTLALVGSSGCGKSTAINLLERFYLPSSGDIFIDDININTINTMCLRSQIGLVTQEPLLFDCSIKDNITYGTTIHGFVPSHFEIVNAARIANIHEFINTLPEGYNTKCGQFGTKMSGGQKQRIAIARAIIRNPKILLLDEATSALDTESEKMVQQALDQARVGRTTIIIAHRLSTIKNADVIAVVHRGKIVELGKHQELLDKQGLYYNLIIHQV